MNDDFCNWYDDLWTPEAIMVDLAYWYGTRDLAPGVIETDNLLEFAWMLENLDHQYTRARLGPVGHDLDTRPISTISPELEKAKTPH